MWTDGHHLPCINPLYVQKMQMKPIIPPSMFISQAAFMTRCCKQNFMCICLLGHTACPVHLNVLDLLSLIQGALQK